MFGPRPRSYSFKLNKNVKRLARRSALSMKAKTNDIIVLEDIDFASPKTKEFKNLLSSLGLADKKSLFVLGESNNNVYLSSRNLKRSKVVTSSEISTYAVMNANSIVLFEGTVEGVVSNLSK